MSKTTYITVLDQNGEPLKQFEHSQEIEAKSYAAQVNGSMQYGCPRSQKLLKQQKVTQ